MTSEFKKNFLLSIVLHVGVLVMIVFVTAFVPTPRTDAPIIMEIVGGGGEPSEAAPASRPAPPTPPPPAKVEQPPEPVEETKPPEPAPARIVQPKPPEMVVPQKKPDPPKRKVEEKPKVEPKPSPKKVEEPKTDAKPKLIPTTRAKFDAKTRQTKPAAKPDPNYSRDAIRQRLAKNVVKVESLGSGPGPANGLSGTAGSDLAAYCSMLSSRLYEVWEIPGQATPSMSTVVVVRVTSDGSLSFVRIMKPSGSIVMDESAIAAVNTLRKVDPLPASLGRVRELTVTFQPLGA